MVKEQGVEVVEVEEAVGEEVGVGVEVVQEVKVDIPILSAKGHLEPLYPESQQRLSLANPFIMAKNVQWTPMVLVWVGACFKDGHGCGTKS